MNSLVSLLAGTQCTQCGYPSCEAYAKALQNAHAAPNLCRPGGARVAQAVAQALNVPYQLPAQAPEVAQVAVINESDCIGCTLCLQKCPTAAIVGAPKQLHTVLPDLCTGCNLCGPVCPTACIGLQKAPAKHALTEADLQGALTPNASKQIWSLVEATRQRANQSQTRTTQSKAQAAPVQLAAMSTDLAAKIAAARQKSAQKYAAKGPLHTPKVLKARQSSKQSHKNEQ